MSWSLKKAECTYSGAAQARAEDGAPAPPTSAGSCASARSSVCSQAAHSGCRASDGSAGDDTGVQLYDLHETPRV